MSLPEESTELPPNTPRRGNRFTRSLGRLLLRLMGWRAVGTPPDCARYVIAAAPHTSNWDGIIFLITAVALGVDVHWIGKHTLFKPPFAGLLVWLGGVPVDRSAAGGLVAGIVAEIQRRPALAVVIAPEGTRGPSARWKNGFYRIAREAQIPIVCGFLDYRARRAGFGPSFSAGEDYGKLLEQMREFYATITPRFPENFVLPEAAPD